MNLRELLLQFAGDNEENLKLEDLLTDNISGIEIEEDLTNGVRVLVENPRKLERIKAKIKFILDKSGYEEYRIIPVSEGNIQHIIITTR